VYGGRAHGRPRSCVEDRGARAAFATVLTVCAATAIHRLPSIVEIDAFEVTVNQLLDVAVQHVLLPVWSATFRGGTPQHASPEPQRTSRWQSAARRGNYNDQWGWRSPPRICMDAIGNLSALSPSCIHVGNRIFAREVEIQLSDLGAFTSRKNTPQWYQQRVVLNFKRRLRSGSCTSTSSRETRMG